MAEAGDEGAYLNCAFTRDEYEAFIDALTTADQFTAHEFDAVPYFDGCMPVEEMARRGRESLRFGPMKPIGLRDPRSDKKPWAVAQLRMEDRGGRMWTFGGLPNSSAHSRAAARLSHDSGFGRRRVFAVWIDSPQLVSQCAGDAVVAFIGA